MNKKYREFYIDENCKELKDEICAKGKECHVHRENVGNAMTKVIEHQALTDLEAKLKIAVEALEQVHKHSISLTDWVNVDEALKQIEELGSK